MFELGLPEIFVIGAAALLLFGPKRLPELAKSLGKGIRDFKKALEEDDTKTSLPPANTQVHTPEVEPKKEAVSQAASGAGGDSGNPKT